MKINSISDAVATLDYLHKRGLLCQQCGDAPITHQNAFHGRCTSCRSPHGVYSKAPELSTLEKRLVTALFDWNAENSPPARGERLGDSTVGDGD